MSDGPSLLASVLAAPDDDAPRLVYADWLDEHAEPERAEFIRVGCELARLKVNHADYIAQSARLAVRERELFQADDAGTLRWFGLPAPWCRIVRLEPFDAVPPNDRRYPYALARRGFLDEARIYADGWMSHGDAITSAHPVQTVTFGTWPHPFGDGERSGLNGDPARRMFTTEELNAAYQQGDALAVNLLRCRWPMVRNWRLL